MTGFSGIDLAVLVAWLVATTAWGAWLGRRQRGGSDYFLGNRQLPWGAVLLSVVATETSTLTFLSIPGVAYLGTLAFLQLTFGYLAGRVVVASLLLPAYFRGELKTAYALLGVRFGSGVRRLTSAIFMVTRLLADSVRLFATAIPLALVTGWPYPLSILVIGALTVVYTYFGGIKAVVWVDAVQMGLYLVGAAVAVFVLQVLVEGGWGAILAQAGEAGKLRIVNPSFDFSVPYTLWAGLLGGGFLAMASHGTDQLIVQRLLTCRDLAASRRALIGSGVVVAVQFAVFLMVGLGLWAFYENRAFDASDEIFARFIVEELPAGVTGLLIAGVFAAAMSSLSSSINSLASSSAYDFWGPGPRDRGRRAHPEGRQALYPDLGRAAGRRRHPLHPAERRDQRRGGGPRGRLPGLRRAPGRLRPGGSLPARHCAQHCGGHADRDRRGHRHLDLRPRQGGVALVRAHRDRDHRAGRRGSGYRRDAEPPRSRLMRVPIVGSPAAAAAPAPR